MKELIQKYEQKLYQAGLVSTGNAVIGALDDECVWNQFHDKRPDLEKILTSLPINALIFAKPAMPFGPIIDNLSASANETICPQDTESRTFLHEIPIIRQWDRNKIIQGLSHRKAVIVPQMGVIATGALTPEQAFVVYSSLCFACFVAFLVKNANVHMKTSLPTQNVIVFIH
ncbi:MAG: hypothetical protein OMM_08048 [Candidatus Magnetoglobus multicellularis str. Araruama]|uniref:Uncharacterized protein n=1 Tax=Candidatus Magnetoglobus multicellularis str. Araruama TaxID=890399 RepID=A0A1V1P9I5_9BACT|nr:MAG: hypothetical protein OMM_08048 [Candidatus Magnetoglobus multicellularis str. Araruama]